MPESIYERTNIIAEVQSRFAAKQREVGSAARQTQVAMAYFTGPLGSEPISRLLKQADPSAVAMHMKDAYLQMNEAQRVDYVKALGYGIAGVLGYRVGRVVIEPWKTQEFLEDTYDLFFAKAHLNKPLIEATGDIPEPHRAAAISRVEAQLVGLDARTTQAIREMLRPQGDQPGKIGDLFRSSQDLRRAPSIDMVIGNWVHPSLKTRVLEAGQAFQAAVDTITPQTQTRPQAKNFLAGLDLS